MSTMTDEFTAWFEAPEQAELRLSCSKGWAELIWQASRASLVVELPPKRPPQGSDSAHWANIRNNTISACSRAIEAAGVRVK